MSTYCSSLRADALGSPRPTFRRMRGSALYVRDICKSLWCHAGRRSEFVPVFDPSVGCQDEVIPFFYKGEGLVQ